MRILLFLATNLAVLVLVSIIFNLLGLEGSLSPILASWLPVLAFGSLGVVLVEGMRT